MPSIILPSRCRQQPQGLVRAKQSFTDAAGGDAFLVNFAIPNVDVIGGRRLTSISHKDDPRFLRLFGETAYHPVGSYSASTYSAIYDRPVTLTDQYTVILRVAGLYYGGHAILGNWYGGTNGVLFSLWSASGYYPSGDGPVGIRGSHQGIADLTGIEGIHKSINGPVTLVITGNESHYKAYSNGVLLGSISHSYAINNTDSNTLLHVGMPSAGGNLYGGIMLASVSGRLISDAHAREISRDPYGELFVPRRRVLYFETAGGGTTVEPSAGNYAYSGAAPTISQPIAVAPVVGGYSYVGNTPVVSQSTSISPTAGGYSYTGNTPSLSQPVTVAPTTGAYAYLGNTPEIIQAAGIYPTAGEYTYAGNTPAISQPRAIAPAVGAYEYLGNVPSVLQIATIQPDAGTIIYTGNTPSISQPRAIAPQDGSYAYAGGVPGVTQTTTTLTAADLAAIWDDIEIEPGISPRMALRILLAAVGGKRVGLGTATEQYMAQDGTTPRITFSPTDAAGNGTPIVDGS